MFLDTLVHADALKRFYQIRRPENEYVLNIGTDEHGTKVKQAADNAKMNPVSYCSNQAQNFEILARSYNISYTDFVRTTQTRHKEKVAEIWNKINSTKGNIDLQNYKGWYCSSDETFVQERDVLYDSATKRHYHDEGRKLVTWTEEENYVFNLGKYLNSDLEKWIEANVYPKEAQVNALQHFRNLKSGD